MKSIDELPDLMVRIIEESEELKDGDVRFSDEAKKLIHEVAEYSRNTAIYKDSSDRSDEFWKNNEKTVKNVWIHMLDRVVNAPTTIHRDSSVILMMPVLDELLAGGTSHDE